MKVRTLVFVGIASVAMALFALACSGGSGDPAPANPSPTIEATLPPTDEPVATPTTEPTSTVVPSPTTPAVPPPSANPVPGSCLVLEEQYCGLGERIVWQEAPVASARDWIAFRRLPAGVAIFSPRDDGVTSGTQGSTMNPAAAHVVVNPGTNPSAPAFGAQGDLTLTPAAQPPSVTKGAVLAYVQDTGVRLLDDYNLVVTFIRFDPSQARWVTDEDTIGRLFPYFAP